MNSISAWSYSPLLTAAAAALLCAGCSGSTPTEEPATDTPTSTLSQTPTADGATPTASGATPTASGATPTAGGATPTPPSPTVEPGDACLGPEVVHISQAAAPAVPDRKSACVVSADDGSSSADCPVLLWKGQSFWAYSFSDNSTSMTLVQAGGDGRVIRTWDKPGARYVWDITIDEGAETVTFHGQGGASVSATFEELDGPGVISVPQASAPAVEGLKTACVVSADDGSQTEDCPVVVWNEQQFWAYSKADNSTAMAIVQVNPDGQVVRTWDKPGARYVWDISVDTAGRSVTFHGQAGASVSATWAELDAPVVAERPQASAPVVEGLKSACVVSAGDGSQTETCPVVLYKGWEYWAHSKSDNSTAMAIVGVDPSGEATVIADKPGARYVYKVEVDAGSQTVTWYGQGDATVSASFGDLDPCASGE